MPAVQILAKLAALLAAAVLLTAPQARASELAVELAAGPAIPDLPAAALARSDGAGGTTITIGGVITPDLAARFARLLDGLAPGRPLRLELDSPGGFTTAGYAMIDRILRERAEGRPVMTHVGRGGACESMCVGLYMAGLPRSAHASASFMVHAPRHYGSGLITLKSIRAMTQRLTGLGAAPGWIARVSAAGGFSGALDYRRSAAELVAEGAGIVTQLVP